MSVDREKLAQKLKEMYPDIERHGLTMGLEWHPDEDFWIVKLEKGHHKLHTHLEAKDAAACLEGVQCVYLGMQIGQFLKNFELLD